MSQAGPLARSGRYLLDNLGITKSSDAFFESMNREVQPVINASPFIAVENLREVSFAFNLTANGLLAVSTVESTAFSLFGATLFSGVLGAGEQCEVRPVIVGTDSSSAFTAQLGVADFASGVLESLYSGGLFFNDPVIVLPGWRIGVFVSTISAATTIPAVLTLLTGPL